MSARTVADYVLRGFVSRDKASVDAVMRDAEKDFPVVDPDDHEEPDGDEGKDTHVHLHIAKDGPTGDTVDGRIKKIEDSVAALDTKFTKFIDAVTAKDGDLPPWLAKGGDDDKKDDKDPDAAPTGDAGELGGEEGAMTAQALSSAEPELMEADPALKTGPSKMGDAAYVAAVQKGLTRLVKDTKARAEMLVPGMRYQTFDAKPKAETAKLLCDMRRDALKKASTTDAGKRLLGRYTTDAITGLDCGAVRLLFMDATDRARDNNNNQGRNFQMPTHDARAHRDSQSQVLRSINERNSQFWANQMGKPN
jgi:hypothetical protein